MTGPRSYESGVSLSRFSIKRPDHELPQARALDWIADAHTASAAVLESLTPEARVSFAARIRRLLDRVGCDPSRIGRRGHVVADVGRASWNDGVIYDLSRHPHGRGIGARMKLFAETVDAYFEKEYADETSPTDLVHVTCTGYLSPSGAQRLVASRGWGDSTRVTHAYHMGCYAAFPALRMAAGFLAVPSALQARSGAPRVDIVHTELCSLHFDPAEHSAEQLVVQSLFADGLIRYSMTTEDSRLAAGPRLRVLALNERLLPESAETMKWSVSDHGMAMTLARDVPARIGDALRSFVLDLCARAGLDAARTLQASVFAVHPGGPKIIDAVRDRLELTDAQVRASRDVLFDYGNMSSATLPHVWARLVDDPAVAPGTFVVSLAFGPGLTLCGAIFQKA